MRRNLQSPFLFLSTLLDGAYMMCRMQLCDSQIYLSVDGLPFSLSPPHAVATLQLHGEAGGNPIKFPLIFACHTRTLGTHDTGTGTQNS
ncbi:hypothetical protein V8E52_008892 [Russula decolorans]|jgi:hypothetical protein